MKKDSNSNDQGKSFEYRLKEMSDEEIIIILKFREHYQPQAVKDAIKEALKRGIISSIEDLDKDEFKPQALPAKSLFPIGYTEAQNIAIFKSLCRTFYIIGILPLIFSYFLFRDKMIIQAITSVIISLSVLFIIFKIEKTKLIWLTQLIMILNIPAIIFAIYTITNSTDFTKLDYAAIIIIVLVLLYISLYLNKITTHINKSVSR